MLVTYIKITEDRQELTRQHNLIMDCLGRRGLTPDIMLSYSDIRLLNREALHPGDMLVVAGMAGLGGSLSQIHDNLKSFLDSGITVLSAAEDCEIRPDAAGALVLEGMALALAVRKSLISVTTSRALAQKKASGVRLGREKNAVVAKRLDGREEEIRNLLSRGLSRREISARLNVSRTTLYNFLKKKKELIYEK